MHPRLFSSLVLIDPVIELGSTIKTDRALGPGESNDVANASTYRRDIWPSRDEATKAFAKSPFYQKWDERVLSMWIQYGLREIPTALYPDIHHKDKSPVTLTTTKHQEVWTFLRPNFQGYGAGDSTSYDRLTHPDIDPSSLMVYPFYRPESAAVYQKLPSLRPPVLYIMGELSNISRPGHRRDKVERTGNGPGGSGGTASGKVHDIILPGIGHLVPMEAVNITAEHSSQWLGKCMVTWREDESYLKKEREGKDRRANLMVDDKWLEHIGGPPGGRKVRMGHKL